jgi:hypothetical protein
MADRRRWWWQRRRLGVAPFWSSRARLERIQRQHPAYRKYALKEIPLTEFLEKALPALARDHVSVGVNWSGAGLTGYDIPVSDLRRNLEYWTKKLAADGAG